MVDGTTLSPQIDAALVGGLVGGITVIVVILVFVAYIVLRKRQTKGNGSDGHAMENRSADSQSHAPRAPLSNSNYDRIDILSHHYAERAVITATPMTTHYDALEPSEI